MSTNFYDINDYIIYTKANTRTGAIKLKDEAKEQSIKTNKCVAILFENRYHLYLAPGHDPYKIRKDIDDWMSQPKTTKSTSNTSSETTIPQVTTSSNSKTSSKTSNNTPSKKK